MTYEASEIDETSGAPERVCAQCHHVERDHIVRDEESPSDTAGAIYCRECHDWHAFIPIPSD